MFSPANNEDSIHHLLEISATLYLQSLHNGAVFESAIDLTRQHLEFIILSLIGHAYDKS
jgi:hypothetical protein